MQHPHPPILIAGSDERKTLRLVARYGDMGNLFDLPGTGFADDLKHKLAGLRPSPTRRVLVGQRGRGRRACLQ